MSSLRPSADNFVRHPAQRFVGRRGGLDERHRTVGVAPGHVVQHSVMQVHVEVGRRAEIIEAQQEGDIRNDVKGHGAAKRGFIKAMRGSPYKALTVLVERKIAQIRAQTRAKIRALVRGWPRPTSCWPSAQYWMNGAKAFMRPE